MGFYKPDVKILVLERSKMAIFGPKFGETMKITIMNNIFSHLISTCCHQNCYEIFPEACIFQDQKSYIEKHEPF